MKKLLKCFGVLILIILTMINFVKNKDMYFFLLLGMINEIIIVACCDENVANSGKEILFINGGYCIINMALIAKRYIPFFVFLGKCRYIILPIGFVIITSIIMIFSCFFVFCICRFKNMLKINNLRANVKTFT